jgi:hypothetical protein
MHPPRKVSRSARSHQRSINSWCPPPGKPRRSQPWGRHRGSVNQGEPGSARPANSLRALQVRGGTEKARARALEVHALRRHHPQLPRLVGQRPPLEHRALPPVGDGGQDDPGSGGAEGGDLRDFGAPGGVGGSPHTFVGWGTALEGRIFTSLGFQPQAAGSAVFATSGAGGIFRGAVQPTRGACGMFRRIVSSLSGISGMFRRTPRQLP